MRRAQPWLTNRSRVLRANAPSAEIVLWRRLRNRQLGGFKFVRQAPIENYFVDFLCRELMLVVEVDGGTHGEPSEVAADQSRSDELQKLGYRVFRVGNSDVYDNIEGVLDHLIAILEDRES
jgi:very-short-patch-repair endonuclease